MVKTAGDYQVYLAFILVFHTGEYFEFIEIFGLKYQNISQP